MQGCGSNHDPDCLRATLKKKTLFWTQLGGLTGNVDGRGAWATFLLTSAWKGRRLWDWSMADTWLLTSQGVFNASLSFSSPRITSPKSSRPWTRGSVPHRKNEFWFGHMKTFGGRGGIVSLSCRSEIPALFMPPRNERQQSHLGASLLGIWKRAELSKYKMHLNCHFSLIPPQKPWFPSSLQIYKEDVA